MTAPARAGRAAAFCTWAGEPVCSVPSAPVGVRLASTITKDVVVTRTTSPFGWVEVNVATMGDVVMRTGVELVVGLNSVASIFILSA